MIRNLLNNLLQMNNQKIAFWCMVLAGFALLGFSAFLFDFEALLKSLPFTPDPDAPWYNGILGFGLFSTLAICISCPRQVVSLVAGFFFGLWSGFLIALFAATFSCVITYALSILMRDHVSGFVSGKISIAVDFWAHNTFLATLVWRFIPAGSNLLTNLAAGALSIPMVRFVTGSAIGYIPHTLVFASLGSGLQLRSGAQIAVSIGLFLVAAGIGAVLVRRYQKQMRADNVNRA